MAPSSTPGWPSTSPTCSWRPIISARASVGRCSRRCSRAIPTHDVRVGRSTGAADLRADGHVPALGQPLSRRPVERDRSPAGARDDRRRSRAARGARTGLDRSVQAVDHAFWATLAEADPFVVSEPPVRSPPATAGHGRRPSSGSSTGWSCDRTPIPSARPSKPCEGPVEGAASTPSSRGPIRCSRRCSSAGSRWSTATSTWRHRRT